MLFRTTIKMCLRNLWASKLRFFLAMAKQQNEWGGGRIPRAPQAAKQQPRSLLCPGLFSCRRYAAHEANSIMGTTTAAATARLLAARRMR